MNLLKNIGSLLQPTRASIATSLIFTVILVGAGLWYADVKTGVLFNALTFGSNVSPATITESQTSLAAFNNRVFGNPLLNQILFYAMWLFIGCLVYILVTAIISFGSEAEETVEEMHYVHAKRAQLERVFLSRLAIRAVAIVLEIIYSIFFVKLLLPYSIYAVHVGVTQTKLLPALLYIGLGSFVLLLSFHIHVVLLRVIALRARLIESD